MSILSVSDFRPHIIVALTTVQQPAERCYIASGATLALDLVQLQLRLYSDPSCSWYDARVLADSHDPFVYGIGLVGLAGPLYINITFQGMEEETKNNFLTISECFIRTKSIPLFLIKLKQKTCFNLIIVVYYTCKYYKEGHFYETAAHMCNQL